MINSKAYDETQDEIDIKIIEFCNKLREDKKGKYKEK